MLDKWRHLCLLATYLRTLIPTVFTLSPNVYILYSASILSLKLSTNIYPQWSTPLWKKVEISPNRLGFGLLLFIFLLKYMIPHVLVPNFDLAKVGAANNLEEGICLGDK